MADRPKEKRTVYVHRARIRLGMGDTSRNIQSESFYESHTLPDGRVELVLLDMNDQPTGLKEIVDQEELEAGYQPVPDYFETRKTKEQVVIEKKLATGRRHLKRQEYFSAEYEFDEVIDIDKKNLEAHLGKSEALFGQGEMEQAQEVLKKVAGFEELYETRNKHVFNAFGMLLRQGGMFSQAIASYGKALVVDPEDENLYFNMGRALFESGDSKLAVHALHKTIQLKPDHSDAMNLLKIIDKYRKSTAG